MMYKVKHGALTICMENPEIPGKIQLERFIPVEIFRKKRYTFQDITFFPFLPKRPKFSVHTICLDYWCQASCPEKVKTLAAFVKRYNSISFLFWVLKN